jgi:hypothetical protein
MIDSNSTVPRLSGLIRRRCRCVIGGDTHGVVVVPEDVRRRLRAVPDHAGKVDGAAPINEQLRTAHDLRVWFWKQQRRIQSIYNSLYVEKPPSFITPCLWTDWRRPLLSIRFSLAQRRNWGQLGTTSNNSKIILHV